jgi:hypothetical protein
MDHRKKTDNGSGERQLEMEWNNDWIIWMSQRHEAIDAIVVRTVEGGEIGNLVHVVLCCCSRPILAGLDIQAQKTDL